MDSLLGFDGNYGSKVCKLRKSLYDLKQSSMVWFDKFTQSVKKQGYTQGQTNHTLFVKISSVGKIALLIVYVNDIILTKNDLINMDRLKRSLAIEFKIKDLGSLKYFLGMEVAK